MMKYSSQMRRRLYESTTPQVPTSSVRHLFQRLQLPDSLLVAMSLHVTSGGAFAAEK